MVLMVESLSTNILPMNEAIVGHLCLRCKLSTNYCSYNHESFDPRKLRSVVGYGYYIDYFNFNSSSERPLSHRIYVNWTRAWKFN